MGPLSRNYTKAIQRQTKLVTFVNKWCGVKESDVRNVRISL